MRCSLGQVNELLEGWHAVLVIEGLAAELLGLARSQLPDVTQGEVCGKHALHSQMNSIICMPLNADLLRMAHSSRC